MRFSLRSMLIVVALTAPTIGWMAKQWTENPERFFSALRLGTSIVPFVLLGLTVIVVALTGQRRQKGLAAWGLLLLITPALGGLAHLILLPNGQPIRVLSTQRLIHDRLAARVDEPWVWNELHRRLELGELNEAQVGEAVSMLGDHMSKKRPGGWIQPLHWQDDFLRAARQQELITDEDLIALSEAYFRMEPRVSSSSFRIGQPGKRKYMVELEFGNEWESSSGFDVAVLYDVVSLTLGGKPISPVSGPQKGPTNWNAGVTLDLVPDSQELVIDVEMAFIEFSKLKGLNRNKLTPAQWPQPLKRWTSTVKVPIEASPTPP